MEIKDIAQFLNPRVVGIIGTEPPDEIVHSDGKEYMHRWFVRRSREQGNIYLHLFLESDDIRALHDHPWPSVSIILDGEYDDVTPNGTVRRKTGDIIIRDDTTPHRVVLIDHKPVLTLFCTGPKTKEWGFFCPEGKVHHIDYHNNGGCAT